MKKLMIASLTFLIVQNISASTRCVAHRGVHHQYAENSYNGVLEVFNQGYDGVEFDLVHDINGDAILMHDKTLKRLATHRSLGNCPLNTKISTLSIAKISQNCVLKDGQPVGTFQGLIERLKLYAHPYMPNLPALFIELKDNPSKKTLLLIEDLLTFYPKNEIFVISFKAQALTKTLRHFSGNIQTMLLEAWATTQLAPILTGHAFNTAFGSLPNFLNNLRKNKKLAYMWTKNKKNQIQELVNLKVDFIATDKPQLCQQVLNH